VTEHLQIPETFKGNWDHLLVLTYGADLPFFENVLLRTGFHCRNKVILADGRKFLQACDRYARDGLVRMLNQYYVADGLYQPNAAHAKVILLTNQNAGKLLVGSGNLGAQGYTSGGEMFSYYEYNEKNKESLPAFQAAWGIMEILLARGEVGGAAERYVRAIYEGTPWLLHTAISDIRPVRHNLEQSFLEQLQQELSGENIQELWVLAPFFDEKARALERLLETFNPGETHVLVQPGYCSVDRAALQRLMEKYPQRLFIRPFSHAINGTEIYTHAKYFLFKTNQRAVCLHGSPNCSQAALLLTSPLGNFEVANLVSGPRESFDDVLEKLNIGPAQTDLSALEIEYIRPEQVLDPLSQPTLLTGLQVQGGELVLYFHSTPPDMKNSSLVIGEQKVPITEFRVEERIVRVALPPEIFAQFGDTIPPIALETATFTSSKIFPQHIDRLDREAKMVSSEFSENSLRNFDPEDPELESLLRELEAALPLDRRSIWELAGRNEPQTDERDSDEVYRLDYADVDYEKLRQHPRILQYSQVRGSSTSRFGQTRLQQILSAITAHFHGLMELAQGSIVTPALPVNEDPELENEPEPVSEQDLISTPVNRNRIRRILKQFVQRYLRGLQSPDFLALVGPDVVVGNYIIFSFVLWRLLQKKDWLESNFVLDSFLQMAIFFWGNDEKNGYLNEVEQPSRQQALEQLAEKKSNALLLGMFFMLDQECLKNGWHNLRLTSRDLWRRLLSDPPFEMDTDLLLDTWRYVHEAQPYNSPTPGKIVADLQDLARVELFSHFLRRLEQRFGWAEDACHMERDSIFQPRLGRSGPVEYLMINAPNALANFEDALRILKLWMECENRTYYRITSAPCLAFYDTISKSGLYYNRETREEHEIGILESAQPAWQSIVDDLVIYGRLADESVLVNLTLSQETNSVQPQKRNA
jgi:hypothetical protein